MRAGVLHPRKVTMSLTRDSILTARDGKTVEVDVPEWGGSLFVRILSGSQRDQLDGYICAKKGTEDYAGVRALLVQLAACDGSGALLFTPADIPAISERNSIALQRVFDAAARLNGLNAGAVEEAASDFPTAPN